MAIPSRSLVRKPLLLWAVALLWIAFFLGLLTWIFWNVRMKASYDVEFRLAPAASHGASKSGLQIETTIPRMPFQSVRAGDPAEITMEGGVRIEGVVRSVVDAPSSLDLALSFPKEEGPPPGLPQGGVWKGTLTLRALRLMAAFSRRAPRPHQP